jgi:hypothetical protein
VRSAVLRGAFWAVALAFPFAALCALVFRFPIPFGGYERGPGTVLHAVVALVFYGALGGFPALLALGALGGNFAPRLGRSEAARVRRLGLAFSALAALGSVLLLAVLDKVIGPW